MSTGVACIAQELLDIWQRLSSQHVALATGCACGIGGVTLRLQDFEQDIADYLLAQAQRAQRSDVSTFLRRHGVDADGAAWHLGILLAALMDTGVTMCLDPDVAEFILSRLGKTLRSFAKLHG
ncbi:MULTISPECIES: hypothetical protein [unclassified Undibacterium]|uniref:hypothetical protein n=1 Tax=unclassified Undibacterium TaxID=2630295 RepID=UPI002AC9EFA3|nr:MULTISPECIES: hypothetical protein [unclassified Undibacterium]MEB0140116.1 hypothetical protein [Undibacterium sp. CCC2.1]MEB0173226.1 hypothetical protein [Undibacterium sp. CCC1.1]MEB0176913.1 hypothetical protein [Undibacterium sp. CCC3.4]MEB0216246.1 hypothetical protein [Undibacterium sp. 5I2]WPX44150.1 hypothetical protein RHM61_02660 [Undibacterium sp. CCC3.4]